MGLYCFDSSRGGFLLRAKMGRWGAGGGKIRTTKQVRRYEVRSTMIFPGSRVSDFEGNSRA